MSELRQKQEFQRFIVDRRAELTRERVIAPRRRANCAEVDVTRIIDAAQRRAAAFELDPAWDCPADSPDEDRHQLEQHLLALQEENEYFAHAAPHSPNAN